ncbi:thermonuclease family protein [Kocuria rosea]|uniref:thermonuclease family protein n=1 Tax=Kocuria rosea TaxID=1275 RepID=UPI003D3298DD
MSEQPGVKRRDPPYRYAARIVRWVDGDTVDLVVDLGFHLSVTTRFRLYGVDTPERGRSGFGEATAFCERLAPVGSVVRIESFKAADSFGRWLALVYTLDGVNINGALVEHGLAVPYLP